MRIDFRRSVFLSIGLVVYGTLLISDLMAAPASCLHPAPAPRTRVLRPLDRPAGPPPARRPQATGLPLRYPPTCRSRTHSRSLSPPPPVRVTTSSGSGSATVKRAGGTNATAGTATTAPTSSQLVPGAASATRACLIRPRPRSRTKLPGSSRRGAGGASGPPVPAGSALARREQHRTSPEWLRRRPGPYGRAVSRPIRVGGAGECRAALLPQGGDALLHVRARRNRASRRRRRRRRSARPPAASR